MKKDKDPFTFYNAPTKIFVEKNDNAPSDEGNFLPQKKICGFPWPLSKKIYPRRLIIK